MLLEKVLLALCWAEIAGTDGRAWLMARARGQGTVEYALVVAGLSVLALAVLGVLSGAVQNAASSAASAVTSAASGASTAKH
jgi:Flp pilus assembly pilin Flp